MDEEFVSNFIANITTQWLNPEIEKRKFSSQIYALLIFFKPTGAEVLLNEETMLTVEFENLEDLPLSKNDALTLSELEKYNIKNIRIPDEIFNNYGYIAAIIVNGNWILNFNLIPNKIESKEKIELAEGFVKAADAANNAKIKSYVTFQALEQAIHAVLFHNSYLKNKIQNSNTHKITKTLVNSEAKMGNIPMDVANLFNRLHADRPKIYSRDNPANILSQADLQTVKNFIELQKRHITQN